MLYFQGMKHAMVLAVTVLVVLELRAQKENPKDLRVLSYNIQMLPRWIAHMGHGPVKRASLIPEKLIADSIDIIIFQEAFDKRCMRIMRRLLEPYYPHVAGPANDRKFGFKLNSGVMIFSKTPLKELESIDFTECEKEDCFSRKGALLVETEWQGQPLQIMGTHMEAGGSQTLKAGQYLEILGMMRKHTRHGVPQLLTGDFNIKKGTTLYEAMLAAFGMEDGPFSGELQYTADGMLNDMKRYDPDDRKVIDYIFYKGNGVRPVFINREVRQYRQRWRKDRQDLSDHLSVLMTIRF